MITMTKDNNFGSTATKPQHTKRTVQIERDVLTMVSRVRPINFSNFEFNYIVTPVRVW